MDSPVSHSLADRERITMRSPSPPPSFLFPRPSVGPPVRPSTSLSSRPSACPSIRSSPRLPPVTLLASLSRQLLSSLRIAGIHLSSPVSFCSPTHLRPRHHLFDPTLLHSRKFCLEGGSDPLPPIDIERIWLFCICIAVCLTRRGRGRHPGREEGEGGRGGKRDAGSGRSSARIGGPPWVPFSVAGRFLACLLPLEALPLSSSSFSSSARSSSRSSLLLLLGEGERERER